MGMSALAYERSAVLGDKRRSKRTVVTVPALLSFEGRLQSAQLQNLSASGALLTTRGNLAPGDRVEFSCGTIRAIAAVRRKVGELIAIEFVTRLPDHQLIEQVTRANAMASRRLTADARSSDRSSHTRVGGSLQPCVG